ncbi:MAG: NADH-quinone oxidoreductase subunit NuoN [Candidatus Protistobacter heckmanni]|nr:NADH-quinone oxidoreductase subunit NuoN [Candidatus Protistobacter heckmanni]
MANLDYSPILPELLLLTAACLILLFSAFKKEAAGRFAYGWSLIVLFVLAIWFGAQNDGTTRELFGGMFVNDPLANLLKAGSALALAMTLIYSRSYLESRDMLGADLIVLVLLIMFGQCVMISSGNFLSLYLGLELQALASYALVAMRRDSGETSEAGMKYFILGALASGFLLYGMSMLYGATGSLDLADIFKAIATGRINKLILVFGLVFVVAGLAFKLGVAPFHMWVPDVYQGSPTAVTLLIGGAPKLAAFAIVIRLLVDGLLPLAFDWQQMLLVLSVLSLIVGNATAIAQTNFKRMLAYSTISHMGFMLLGMLSGVVGGKADFAANAYGAALFYSITYVLTTLGTFGMILLLSRKGFEAEELSDLKGLNRKSPWFAFLLLLMMFSLAGIPPTVGFYAKLTVLQAVVDAGMVWLAVLAVLTSLVGAFYYLRVVKLMYFDEPEGEVQITTPVALRGVLSLNGIAILWLGVAPTGLIALCITTIRQTLAS